MSMVINTNMGAVNAQRMLSETSRDQSTSMERLTSGLRINKAADDAAGLAVATGMTTQIKGTDMAIRNANDTIGMIQTLDGATEEVVNMLQRMRELSVQSLNGTYNNDNRVQMQQEFGQLQKEIDRVADTTKFNGMNIMNNSTFASGALSATAGATSAAFIASVASIAVSATFKTHVGWENGSANKMGMVTLDFTTLSAIVDTDAVRLHGSGISTYGSAAIEASTAITAIDGSLSVIKNMQAYWGAMQNRLESTVSNLDNVNENITASRSRIQDTDFAKESANLARTQVLQQAGMSMLSQANQQSQQVMSLIR